MDTIVATEVFDHFDKTYLLDRIKGSMTGPVIRITETVHSGTRRGRYTLEIDAAVLKRIQHFIEAPVPDAPTIRPVRKRPFFTGEQCDTMVKSYLKGVTSDALAVQYGCKAEDIEEVIRREGIEVVDQNPPKPKRYGSKWSYRRKN
ncbi:MAG: hypothetical protein IPL64_04335 [Flavobacteriales bacterium]|nr:hypothetical protein [Flavobacteriales bacterium]